MTLVAVEEEWGEVGRHLRTLRIGRRLTLRAVAEAAGVTEGYLSQIETGRSAPSLKTFRRIVSALGMNPADVLDAADVSLPRLITGRDGRHVRIGAASKQRVTPSSLASMEILRGVLAVGGSTGERYSHGDSEEVQVVVSGSVTVDVDGREFTLDAGDALCYRSSMGHSARNTGDEPAVIMWITSPPAHASHATLTLD